MPDNDKKTDQRAMLEQALQAIEQLQSKLSDVESNRHEPIAIVGMSCRFPGAASAGDYWELLDKGNDAVRQVPAGRLEGKEKYPMLEGIYGGFLDQIDTFEPGHFGISGREAETMDPQQRLVLEVAWEALENAGISPDTLKGSLTGVFVGVTTNDYARMALADARNGLDVYSATGGALNVVAGRISYTFGFNGPAMAIDTACSSSLVAMHIGCQSLRNGESNVVLAGGVNMLLAPEPFVCFADWGMMAPDGRCKTFDAKADGFVRSEGCGVVVLKRLNDAIESGDNILALIRGSAVNQDGASSGLTVPNGLAQEAVLRAALKDAHVRADEIDYIEAHGTGTTLGDPIELEAIARVIGKNRTAQQVLHVGSVKTNLGHAESASGIAGLIKIVLSMRHETIPRHLHFESMSPQISIGKAPIKIPKQAVAWPKTGRRRIAGVSSFGFSGTNAHVIIEEAPDVAVDRTDGKEDFELLLLSARHEQGLAATAGRYRELLSGENARRFSDVCFTAATGRARLSRRLALVARSSKEAAALLAEVSTGVIPNDVAVGEAASRPRVAFIYTGQGSQAHKMGVELYEREPVFREAFDRCAIAVRDQLPESLQSIIGYEAGGKDPRLVHETRFTQPALFAFEFAMTELWRHWGVRPVAVMGHSLGEYVAACVAGVMSPEDAMSLVTARAALMQEAPGKGAMIAVFASSDRLEKLLRPYDGSIAIAAINGPDSTVLSGEKESIDAIVAELGKAGIEYRELQVSHAFHSPMMNGVAKEFLTRAKRTKFGNPNVDLVLNVSGEMCTDDSYHADYLLKHMLQPVQFYDSVMTLLKSGIHAVVEIGPAPVLSSMLGQFIDESVVATIPSMRDSTDARRQLLVALGKLTVAGIEPDWPAVIRGASPRKVALPGYAFNRKRYWLKAIEDQHSRSPQYSATPGIHPFLGHRVSTALAQGIYECSISLSATPDLRDHRISGTIVFPAAAYIEVASAAGSEFFDCGRASVVDGWFREPLILDDRGRRVQVIVTPKDAGSAEFEVLSCDDQSTGPWTCHAGGKLLRDADSRKPAPFDVSKSQKRCNKTVDIEAFQARLHDVGLEYGPTFRGLTVASAGDNEAFGELKLAGDGVIEKGLMIHPGILDAAFHLIGVAIDNATADPEADRFYLPVGFSTAILYQAVGTEARAHVALTSADRNNVVADIRVVLSDGSLAAEVLGLQARGMSRAQFRKVIGGGSDVLHHVEWDSFQPAADPAPTGHWLIIGKHGSLQDDIRDHVVKAGATCDVVVDVSDKTDYETITTLVDLRPLAAGPVGIGQRDDDAVIAATLELIRRVSTVDATTARSVLVVTRNSFALGTRDSVNPVGTAIWGLAATAAAELDLTTVRVIDADNTVNAENILFAACNAVGEDRLALRDSKLHVPRLKKLPPNPAVTLTGERDCYALDMATRGTISGLEISHRSRRSPGPGQVEIEVLASGVNFRDVLNALDMYPGPASDLGNECCGRIVAVGADVERWVIGDVVSCIAEATFGSHVVAEGNLLFGIPASLSLAQAAVFPIAQLTAYLSLVEIARLKKGERVLIHAGAGGVGLAAVHLALAVGAEVLATAGSEEKRTYLLDNGVKTVFDSRAVLPHDDVLAATDGHGVDVLVNSLIGESIDEGLRSLSMNGRFIEIGLRDVRDASQVAEIRPDVAYHALLLGDYCRDEPEFVQKMYAALVALLAKGAIPPPNTRAFAIADVESAFNFMAKARHIGRVAVTHPALGRGGIRSDSSYLVTGGLGGLGLIVASWLADRGAGAVVLVGRKAPDEHAAAIIGRLRERGCDVHVVPGDIAVSGSFPVDIAKTVPPIRGVIHAAGIVDDSRLSEVDAKRLSRVLDPKVAGLRNIINSTGDHALDFLVLFSSGSAILGSPGQVAYSSANAFLDGAAHRLAEDGIPAVSINWGAWESAGMASNLDPRVIKEWASRGIGRLTDDAAIRALEDAVGSGLSQVAVLPIDWDKYFSATDAAESPGILSALGQHKAAAVDEQDSFVDSLQRLSDKRRLSAITSRLRAEIAAVLGVATDEIEVRSGLSEQGMDSLMAVELAGRVGRIMSVKLPTTFVFDHPTISALASHLDNELGSANESSAGSVSQIDEGEAEIVDNLTEAELEAALRAELDVADIVDE